MRTLAISAALVLGCHGSGSSSSSSSSAPAEAKPGSASGSGSAATPVPAAAAHPMPAAMAELLKPYGDLHGTPIYVPAAFKDPEHWIAFVGGAAAQSAWLVTPADKDHAITPITDWPTALQVDGALVEAKDRGLPTSDHASVAWILVTSLPGMGQPGGVHGVVRVELEGVGFGNEVSTNDNTLAALAGVTKADDVGAKVDAVAAEYKITMDLMTDDASQKLVDALADVKTTDADLAALIPKAGVGLETAWQKLLVQPTGRAKTPADLRTALGGRRWTCQYTSCSAPDAVVLLGVEGGKVVLRDLMIVPVPAQQPGAYVHAVTPLSEKTDETDRALRERGVLGAKGLAQAPYGAHGSIGVARADGGGGLLVVHDKYWTQVGTIQLDDSATAANLRFADVDGDGAAELVIAAIEAPGVDGSDLPGGPTYTFATLAGEGHDLPAGLAAIGAKDIDDAVARALAVPLRPVTAEQACALLDGVKHSLKKAGPHARVMAFIEPSDPEIGHGDLGKGGAESVHELVGDKCELVCDAKRPACERPGMGPDTDYALFGWNGDKLELVLAMVYRGA
jgi:hypothetical protein